MGRLWRSLTSPHARLSRWGIAFCLLALLLWLSTIAFRTGRLPARGLREAAEFLVATGAVLYGIDKAAGHIRRNGSRQKDDE